MARVSTGRRLSQRARERRFANSVPFPRWVMAAFVLIIGLMLWLGVLADPLGDLRTPGLGSIFYVAAVIAVAIYLAYADRNRDTPGKNRRFRPQHRGRRGATAK